ncbi:hypothetical protein M9458_009670, partial [Cirrhinus mrigala]
MPFDGGDHQRLIRQISNGEYREPPHHLNADLSKLPDQVQISPSYSDARGLIRWMLMVNPDRRATVEDIANHWWVNWGWKTSVENSSPMLARFIDWQNRTEVRPGKAQRPEPGNGNSATALTPARRLRKSMKENDGGMPQETKEHPEDSRNHLCEVELRRPEREDTLGGSPAKMVSMLPKKGILKNNQQRESGYYSSPERRSATVQPPNSSPPKRTVGRKGILKRNGKYSTHNAVGVHGEAQGDSTVSRSQSRPSSIFIGLDWPPASPKPNIRGSLSAEDLLQMAGFRGLQTVAPLPGGKGVRSPPGSPGDNGSFSLLGDLDDVTQV